MSFTLAQTLPIRTWPRPDRRVPAAAAWPDAVRSGPVMRFVRNNQHHLLFHRLTLPEQVQPLRRACTGGIAAGEGGNAMDRAYWFADEHRDAIHSRRARKSNRR